MDKSNKQLMKEIIDNLYEFQRRYESGIIAYEDFTNYPFKDDFNEIVFGIEQFFGSY